MAARRAGAPARGSGLHHTPPTDLEQGDFVQVQGDQRSRYIAEVLDPPSRHKQRITLRVAWMYTARELRVFFRMQAPRYLGRRELLRSDHDDLIDLGSVLRRYTVRILRPCDKSFRTIVGSKENYSA